MRAFVSKSKAAGTSGQYLQSNGAAAPTWVTPSSGGVTTMSTNTTATANSATITGSTLQLTVPSYQYRGVHYGLSEASTTDENVVLGYQSFGGTGNLPKNTIVGARCCTANGIGRENAIHGYGCAPNLTGSYNVIHGNESGPAVTTASYNVMMGWSTGKVLTTGQDNIYLGRAISASGTAVSNEYVLGGGLTGSGSNTITFLIGSIPVSTQVALHINTTTGQLTRPSSSRRYKNDMPLEPILTSPELLLQLQPRSFTFKADCENIKGLPAVTRVGYYAEEVASIVDADGKPVFASLLDIVYEDDTTQPEKVFVDGYSCCHPKKIKAVEGFNYAQLTVALLELVKKQDARITALEAKLF